MNNDIELAVFDMAGTTVRDDGLVVESFAAADREARLSSTPAERAEMLDYVDVTMGQSKITVFRHLARGDEATAQAANAAFEQSYAQLVAAGKCEPMPGAVETFDACRRRGIKIALTTGFARATQEAILTALGWDEIADVTLCPSESVRGRPFPDLVFAAVMQTGAHAVGNVVVVGDTSSDISTGVSAGAGSVVGVLTGAHDRSALVAAGATQVLDSVADLPQLWEN